MIVFGNVRGPGCRWSFATINDDLLFFKIATHSLISDYYLIFSFRFESAYRINRRTVYF